MRENGGEQGAPLRLVVVTPQGIAAQAACDSVAAGLAAVRDDEVRVLADEATLEE